MSRALRVHIGPVQPWIAAGRRTRDFWAGSFLLSRLSGQAMADVLRQDGQITIPVVQDRALEAEEPTLKAIRDAEAIHYDFGEDRIPSGPLVGTLVNHFRAEVPDGFSGEEMAKAVRARFKSLADAVWAYFFAEASREHRWPATVKQRWDFQTSGTFFEILWVMGSTETAWPDESRWLDQRKAFRARAPLSETDVGLPGTGDRCPVHPDLCELGGFFRAQASGHADQDQFWDQVRLAVARGVYGDAADSRFIETLEIRPDEHLSALALVKRLFPLLPPPILARTIGWVPDHMFELNVEDAAPIWDPQAAQRALRNWPSTAFVAAIPWIIQVGSEVAPAARAYTDNQYKALGVDDRIWAERPQHHRVEGIDNLGHEPDDRGIQAIPRFAVLDGTLHFRRGLDKHRFSTEDPATAKALADELNGHFNSLLNAVDKAFPSARGPRPFYAMLEMDGDGMGVVFSHDRARAETGSRALLAFAAGVPQIVREHDGVLIYAGADDVNAMLPTATAIACAQAIRRHWADVMANAFAGHPDVTTPTLSGSIVFADYQNALDETRRLTHERLDRVAKDGMGRNALALAVAKSGGVTAEWASCWDAADPARTSPVQALFDYAFAAGSDKSIASRLPYLIRDRFQLMLDSDPPFDDTIIGALLTKEMGDSGLSSLGAGEKEKAEAVVAVLRPYGRKAGQPHEVIPAPRHVGGLLIARFLADAVLWRYVEAWRTRGRP